MSDAPPRGDGTAADAGPRRRWLGVAARAAVTVVVLGLLVAYFRSDALLEAIRRAPFLLWLGVLAGLACGHGVAAIKWRLFVTAAGASCRPGEAIRAHAAGLFTNLCLPSIVGGDVVRAGMLARGRSLTPIALGSLADRLVDTAALVLLAAAGAALAPAQADLAPVVRVLGGVSALLLVAGVAAPLALLWVPEHFIPQAGRAVATKLRSALGELARNRATASLGFAVSLGVQACFVWLNATLGAAIGIAAPLSVWYLAWPLAKIAGLLPVSLGGLGVREAALAGLLAPFGVLGATAVAQGLLWQAALITLGLACGAAVLASGGFARSLQLGQEKTA